MTPEQLKASIIQSALEGKITQQRIEDTPVAETLNRIQELRNAMIKRKEIKKVSVLPIDDTVPFDIPDSWKWVRIGAIEEINLGFTYRPEYTDEGVYFLSVKDISGGKIDFQNAKKVSQETYDNAAYGSKPRKGDILFGRVGTMGKPQIIDTDEPFCIFVSLGFFRDHTNIVVKEYIALWMQSVLFNKQVDENVRGSAQRNLNTGWLKDFYIPFPPIEEQHRIVAKIEELLPYVDRYAKAYEKIEHFNAKFPEEMKKSILQYAIQGKLVEQRPEEGTAEELYQQIQVERKEYKIKDLQVGDIVDTPFDIPESWKWIHLQDIVKKTIKRGKSPKYTEKSSVQVFAQKCNAKTGGINMSLALFLDEASIEKYPVEEYMCDGDIVINSTGGGTMGRVGVFHDTDRMDGMPIVPDGHVTVIRACDMVDYKYLYYFIKHNQKYLETQGEGSTNQTELKPVTIASLILPLPPLQEQHRIVSKIEELLPLCDQLVK